MTNPIQVATIRGAGLAVPIACLWYVFSGNPAVFSLVLVGVVMGFTAGLVLNRLPGLKTKSPLVIQEIEPRPTRQTGLMKYLAHENPIIRFASLVAAGTLLFLTAWFIGYYLLPEAIFHGGAEAHMTRVQLTTSSASVFEEWTRIFTANLIPVLVILLGGLLIRVNGLTFGYLVALFNLVGYGLFVGTNSFAIPYPERLAPSFEILSRSGPYEMLALVLLATSSYFWPFFEIKRIFYTSVERVEHWPRFYRKDAIGFGIGLVILIAANWLEAVMIMSTR